MRRARGLQGVESVVNWFKSQNTEIPRPYWKLYEGYVKKDSNILASNTTVSDFDESLNLLLLNVELYEQSGGGFSLYIAPSPTNPGKAGRQTPFTLGRQNAPYGYSQGMAGINGHAHNYPPYIPPHLAGVDEERIRREEREKVEKEYEIQSLKDEIEGIKHAKRTAFDKAGEIIPPEAITEIIRGFTASFLPARQPQIALRGVNTAEPVPAPEGEGEITFDYDQRTIDILDRFRKMTGDEDYLNSLDAAVAFLEQNPAIFAQIKK